MTRGKLIVLEGTDASGKETQTDRLYNRLVEEGYKVARDSFPMYNSESGKLIGGPFLGKPEICKSFYKRPSEEDAKSASLLYAHDRRHNLPVINEYLDKNDFLILDRYTGSNMGMQGGKLKSKKERKNLWKELDNLEYGFAELPRSDLTLFLHMPYEIGMILKSKMGAPLDEVEKDKNYLENSENAYLQLADFYDWPTISCARSRNFNDLKSKDEIEKEVWDTAKNKFFRENLFSKLKKYFLF